MSEKEVMIEFQNRIDALETKIEKISSQVSSCVSLFDRLEKRMEPKIKRYDLLLELIAKISIFLLFFSIGVVIYVIFWR